MGHILYVFICVGKTIVRSLHFTLTKFQTKAQKSSKVHFIEEIW